LEYKREAALLQGLQQQTARLEAFVYNYKNNDEEYIKVINSIEKKGTGLLSDKKAFLKLAIFSLIQSMNPLSSTSSNILDMKGSGQVILLPPPYDEYIIEDYKAIVLEEAEKLYNLLTDQLLCEVINESVAKQSPEAPPSLPGFPPNQDNQQEPTVSQ
jgi:hypothetical protein